MTLIDVMRCGLCGSTISGKTNFCTNCGGRIENRPEVNHQRTVYRDPEFYDRVEDALDRVYPAYNLIVITVSMILLFGGIILLGIFYSRSGIPPNFDFMILFAALIYVCISLGIGAYTKSRIIIGHIFIVTGSLATIVGFKHALVGGGLCIGTMIFASAVLIVIGVLIIINKINVTADPYPWWLDE